MSPTTARAPEPDVLRIGNCSGFYGDRLAAMREMLEGGPLDVLTGDYLAELTMLILGRDRAKDPGLGYARTFLRQLEDCLGLALDKGVRIVANAGGLNPQGCASAVHDLAQRLGLTATVAVVDGDDLTDRVAELGLGSPLAANAYLGAFGIADACRADADIVITGRVTDASVVVGPAIAHFDWAATEFDAIAGAMAAGHVIECGTQATGGNFAFFGEVPDLTRPGFPIAEIRPDGSSIITKHPGTGGAVTVDTVTSQLLYEVQDARYAGPDAVLRLDSVALEQDGPDRVLLSGARGEAPPPELKVSCTRVGGFRNEMTFVLTGLDIDAKAELTRRQVESALPVRPAELAWTLARTDHDDPDTQERAAATLTVVARDPDEAKVGRAFSGAAVEIALGSYPGCFLTSPPGRGNAYGVYEPRHVPQDVPTHTVTLPDGTRHLVAAPPTTQSLEPLHDTAQPVTDPGPVGDGRTVHVPLGTVAGARSGDKGGNANIGVWVRSDAEFAWLESFLTVERLRELLPETRDLTITRTRLPRLRALNFVVEGLLGEGVAYAARFDPQAKALGEWLRARHVDIPAEIFAGFVSHATKETRS
ncbi:acyclic terpene utilization AtuA family protein [Flexivirga sp. B27]